MSTIDRLSGDHPAALPVNGWSRMIRGFDPSAWQRSPGRPRRRRCRRRSARPSREEDPALLARPADQESLLGFERVTDVEVAAVAIDEAPVGRGPERRRRRGSVTRPRGRRRPRGASRASTRRMTIGRMPTRRNPVAPGDWRCPSESHLSRKAQRGRCRVRARDTGRCRRGSRGGQARRSRRSRRSRERPGVEAVEGGHVVGLPSRPGRRTVPRRGPCAAPRIARWSRDFAAREGDPERDAASGNG